MTTLDPKAHCVTLINTFTVAPSRADELLELLQTATIDRMRHLPGFISANLHVSLDRGSVANYAQWRSREDFEAMQHDAEAQIHMREAASIAESFEPVLYDLRYVDASSAKGL